MVAAHHPPPHPHNRPATPIVRRQTNRSPALSKGVVILRDVRITFPAFVGGRPAR
jgi:hypothetical protein